MAKMTINVGAAPNDGTGDTLRVAGQKINQNFTELYDAQLDQEPTIEPGQTTEYWRGDKTWAALNKAAVGLASVDDTADASKPVSTAQAAAIALKLDASQKGAVNGVATLDADGRVPGGQLPVTPAHQGRLGIILRDVSALAARSGGVLLHDVVALGSACVARASGSPSRAVTLDLFRNGAKIGEVAFAQSQTLGVVTFTDLAARTLVAGDLVELLGPPGGESSLVLVSLLIRG